MLGAVIQVLLSGFIIGALARWAVPGPDPMPIWLTIVIGVVGSFIGGGIASALFGADQDSGSIFAILIGSILVSTVLVVLYRRFVQHRPITGPDAYRPPANRPRKLRDVFGSPAKQAYKREETVEQLRKLNELKNEGLITDDDYETKKAELLARL